MKQKRETVLSHRTGINYLYQETIQSTGRCPTTVHFFYVTGHDSTNSIETRMQTLSAPGLYDTNSQENLIEESCSLDNHSPVVKRNGDKESES